MYTNCPTKHALTSTLVTNNNLMTTQNISQPNASPPASCAKKAGGGRKSQFANRQPQFIQHSPKPPRLCDSETADQVWRACILAHWPCCLESTSVNCPPGTNTTALQETFKRYVHRVHPNKSLKIWEKMERGRIQRLPKFDEYPLLSQEWVKLRTANLAGICNEDSQNFSGHPYIIGRIARSSLR